MKSKSNLIWLFGFLIFLHSINSYCQKRDSITLENAVIYYYSYGSGEPIILLSGGPGWNHQQVSDVAEALASKYNAIVPDQRGTGSSWTKPLDSTTINLKVAVEDLEILREKLSIKKMNLYGHSWGGMLAAAYAAKYPNNVKLLILVGSGELSFDYYYITENSLKARFQISDSVAYKFWTDSTNNSKNPEKAKFELRRLHYYKYIFDRNKIDELLAHLSEADMNKEMQSVMWKSIDNKKYNLTIPLTAYKGKALVIFGWQDPIGVCTFYNIKEVIPQSVIRGIDQCGHFPSIEQPNEFYSILYGYLSENL